MERRQYTGKPKPTGWDRTLSPLTRLAQGVIGQFMVREEQLATILQSVRAQLPTTEALLLGKSQAGKSSIVRGITNTSREIIGQGFRPHTQHTARYAYPSQELPLLLFTDTVGLGDANQETEAIVQELTTILGQKPKRAGILVLTVKINDFATDSLRRVVQQLRQQAPDVPCLLAITCLHELYPADTQTHPPYPPAYPAIEQALAVIQQNFKGLWDHTVLLDFTLEEDGYTPVFYGLEALGQSLADLLPETEATAIYQLLDHQETSEQLSSLYRRAGRHYTLAFGIMAATISMVPLPFATMPVLTTLQVSMIGFLGKLYGQVLSPSQALGVVSAIGGGFLAQTIGRELVKVLPGFGSLIAASWAGAYTLALGEGACVYFGDLMGGKKPSPGRIQAVMRETFQVAQGRFRARREQSV